jgi:hypothetical protein
MNKTSLTTYGVWAVFVALLAALLPHTAWAFRQYEPMESPILLGTFTWADLISYVLAFAFEAAIAVLTHKLAKHFEATKEVKKQIKNADGTFSKVTDEWQTFKARYVNSFMFGLIITTCVSGMANLAHAVQFGQSLTIFTKLGINPNLYSFAFGGVLPLVSLTFANVLSNVTEDEAAPNPEMEEAKKTILSIRQQLRDTESKLRDAEGRVKAAEEKTRAAEDRFAALGDVVKYLFGEDKRQRIVISRKQWPQLPGAAIAIIAGASPAYVSEVLREVDA